MPCVPVKWAPPPPNNECCPFTGLSHAYFYNKLLRGPFEKAIVHVSLRGPDEARGTTLIFIPSVHQLLWALATKPDRVTGLEKKFDHLAEHRFDHAEAAVVPQAWLRVPPNGSQDWFTGLGHSSFYKLLESAGQKIAVAQLRLPEETRATKLAWVPSVHAHFISLARMQARLAAKSNCHENAKAIA